LFDKSGGAASGNKQDAVNGAAMTVMKLLVQSKFSGAIGGGNSGGLGGLLSLVWFILLRHLPARIDGLCRHRSLLERLNVVYSEGGTSSTDLSATGLVQMIWFQSEILRRGH